MEFNNGNERRKLNKKWERLRVQYQQAGMSEDAIQAMYDFDLGVLNSERSYVANTLAIVGDGDDSTGRKSSDFKQYEKAIAVTDTYHETRTRFAWVGEIKDKRLQEGLEKLSDEELRLITLYFRDEYSTVELSKVYGIAQQNISKRINKRKHELYELHINEQEAAVVRIVFDKYVYEGYGPQHIATYLNNSGYRARSGKCWHPSSIRGMVQNLTYTGVLRCGDARSELMPDLQIVPQEQFENAQRIRNERSVRSTAEAENRLPLNIHGKSLLAGNAYCGHCGAKLELTSSRKWRKMADGSLDDTLRIRYTCYGKLRKQTNCTGQTGYTVHILDEIIDKAVRQIFSKMRGIPKKQIVTKRYEKENAERKNHLQDLQTQRNKAEKDLFALKTEVLACIKGESVLPRETLAEMITAQEEKLTELENLCEAASEELEKTAELMDKVSRLYDELISYADLYDSANFEAKKMIVNQLIRRVDVYRGYQINISFNFDLTPYIEGE